MANYKSLIPFILKAEGGFSNHPADKGGATNKGVTIATFRKFYGQTKTVSDLKNMTDAQWEHIFKKGYWDRWKADQIKSQSIANILVDWVWGSGVYGIKIPQKILGVEADGIVGPQTIGALNNYPNQKELFDKIWARRKKFFEDIVVRTPSQRVFLRGWLNRLGRIVW